MINKEISGYGCFNESMRMDGEIVCMLPLEALCVHRLYSIRTQVVLLVDRRSPTELFTGHLALGHTKCLLDDLNFVGQIRIGLALFEHFFEAMLDGGVISATELFADLRKGQTGMRPG